MRLILLAAFGILSTIFGIVVLNGSADDKIEATPKEIAHVLYQSLEIDMTKLGNGQLFKDFKGIKNPEALKKEMYFLKAFATNIAILSSDHKEHLKDMVQEAFLNELIQTQ